MYTGEVRKVGPTKANDDATKGCCRRHQKKPSQRSLLRRALLLSPRRRNKSLQWYESPRILNAFLGAGAAHRSSLRSAAVKPAPGKSLLPADVRSEYDNFFPTKNWDPYHPNSDPNVLAALSGFCYQKTMSSSPCGEKLAKTLYSDDEDANASIAVVAAGAEVLGGIGAENDDLRNGEDRAQTPPTPSAVTTLIA